MIQNFSHLSNAMTASVLTDADTVTWVIYGVVLHSNDPKGHPGNKTDRTHLVIKTMLYHCKLVPCNVGQISSVEFGET